MNMEEINQLTKEIIGTPIEVHHTLGSGLLESAYETCLSLELVERGLNVDRQKPLPVIYKGNQLEAGYRLDLFVEVRVIVEVKAVNQ